MYMRKVMVSLKTGETRGDWSNDSWTYKENGNLVYYPSTKAIEEALEKSMA